MTKVRPRCQLIPSKDIDDPRILESNWISVTGKAKPKVVVLDTTFL